jgi:hypothetical protein
LASGNEISPVCGGRVSQSHGYAFARGPGRSTLNPGSSPSGASAKT